MARAIEFTEDYGRILKSTPSEKKGGKPTKDLVGGFQKGQVWPGCSSQLAAKLVNRLGVAKYVEEKSGDALTAKVAAAKTSAEDIIAKAKADAKKIVEEAKAEAAKSLE